MSDDDVIRKTSIYMKRGFLKRLKNLAVKKDTSVNAIMLDAIEREYSEARPTQTEAPPAAPSRHQDMVDKLIYILDSESKDAIRAVVTNINVFFRLVRVDDQKTGRKEMPEERKDANDNDKLTG